MNIQDIHTAKRCANYKRTCGTFSITNAHLEGDIISVTLGAQIYSGVDFAGY